MNNFNETYRQKLLLIVVSLVLTVLVGSTAATAAQLPDTRFEDAVVVALDANLALVSGSLVRIDQTRTVAPYIDSADRTKVPLRFISEAFSVEVEWDAASKTAKITDGETQISFREGENMMTILKGNLREDAALESPATIHYGRLFLPLRAIADALQKEVFFDRGLIIISSTPNLFDAEADKDALDAVSDMLGVLPTVGSAANFERILDEIFTQAPTRWPIYLDSWSDDILIPSLSPSAPIVVESAAPAPSEMPALGAGSTEFSETNVQVQGVDEADVVKTDGELIYYLRSSGELVIVRAYPAHNMEVLQKLNIGGFSPREMYVDGDDLVLIGSRSAATQIFVYSIADVLMLGNDAVPRIITIEGNYLSSRKIGENVYVTANLPIRHGRGGRGGEPPEIITPFYSDSVGMPEAEPRRLSFNQIRCFPDPQDTNYLIVAAFNVGRPEQSVNVSAYIGAGENIYMSRNNMYVAKWDRNYYRGFHGTDGGGDYTVIYRFGLGQGRLIFSGSGKVDGTVLTQWSMDEHNGYFRIATTKNWLNFVFVLNEDLEVVGEIRDIAPTERIYSARFMGDTLYMVTFFIIDPFFVIDLSDPYSPRILGELKIPGYSDYLHPFGENLILGIGKDAEESYGMAWEQGIRMTMFDVSDFQNPVDLFHIIIGGRGTTSEALRNHRAFLISPERNLIAFPATVHGYNTDPTIREPQEFQGGLVYGADFERGEFYLRGTITHQTERTDALGRIITGQSMSSARALNRMLYIGDFIYGMSDFGISAHDMIYIEEVNKIEY